MKRGCLYCYSGNMDRAIELFQGFYPDIRLIYPQRVRRRRFTGNAYIDEIVPLLPGYLFFETDHDLPNNKLVRTDYLLRLLTYTDGEWVLHGADDLLAKALFEAEGVIGLSTAYYDINRKIRIVDGFLKPYEDAIVSVNHRKKTAEININLQDQMIDLWLGFELIEPAV